MECRFPARLALWLGREFYRGRRGDPDLSRCFHVTSRPVGETINRSPSECRSTGIAFGVRTSLESLIGVLNAVRARKLLDAERY
ncbi:hypothetical protein AVEN_41610-1 [Araneus ventricosus]|uniref:Uncharacterized protein n=1 Tax=Araneus ventricosus TaxID=182803 RepID=A0A4Y2JU25_ARAVE|nr:hypothetical protein AVEN_41610-1 [Araneus ventricosus]